MRPRAILALLFAFAAAGCGSEVRTLAYPDGELFEIAEWRGPMRDGFRRNTFRDGTVQREAHYERGEPAGTWSYHAEDGTLLVRGAYRAGRRAGEWIENHPNGRPKARGAYRNGVRDGTWEHFDESGVLEFEADWVEGTLLRARSVAAR